MPNYPVYPLDFSQSDFYSVSDTKSSAYMLVSNDYGIIGFTLNTHRLHDSAPFIVKQIKLGTSTLNIKLEDGFFSVGVFFSNENKNLPLMIVGESSHHIYSYYVDKGGVWEVVSGLSGGPTLRNEHLKEELRKLIDNAVEVYVEKPIDVLKGNQRSASGLKHNKMFTTMTSDVQGCIRVEYKFANKTVKIKAIKYGDQTIDMKDNNNPILNVTNLYVFYHDVNTNPIICIVVLGNGDDKKKIKYYKKSENKWEECNGSEKVVDPNSSDNESLHKFLMEIMKPDTNPTSDAVVKNQESTNQKNQRVHSINKRSIEEQNSGLGDFSGESTDEGYIGSGGNSVETIGEGYPQVQSGGNSNEYDYEYPHTQSGDNSGERLRKEYLQSDIYDYSGGDEGIKLQAVTGGYIENDYSNEKLEIKIDSHTESEEEKEERRNYIAEHRYSERSLSTNFVFVLFMTIGGLFLTTCLYPGGV